MFEFTKILSPILFNSYRKQRLHLHSRKCQVRSGIQWGETKLSLAKGGYYLFINIPTSLKYLPMVLDRILLPLKEQIHDLEILLYKQMGQRSGLLGFFYDSCLQLDDLKATTDTECNIQIVGKGTTIK